MEPEGTVAPMAYVPIGELLGMNRNDVGNRSIRRDDDGPGAHNLTFLRFDSRGTSPLHIGDMRFCKEVAAIPANCRDQPVQVFHGVELSLAWETKTGARVETLERTFVHQRYLGKTDTMTGVELSFQDARRSFRRHEKETVEPFEVAIDAFRPHDGFDLRNCLGVAFGRRGALYPGRESFLT
jgi:hypothetical protein